jgi:hypothetical protein
MEIRVARPEETQTRVDFVMLCDHAEVVAQNGKLYISGGGWNRISRPVPITSTTAGAQPGPPPQHFAIATSVLVDWNETNEAIPLRITIEGPGEHDPPLLQMDGRLEVGRPPAAMKGVPIRTMVAYPILINFPRAGEYSVRVCLMDRRPDPQSDKTERFDVVDVPMYIQPPADS